MNDEIKDSLRYAIITALTFVVALQWREFFNQLVARFIPESQRIFYSFGVTILVTLLALLAIYLFLRAEQTVGPKLEQTIEQLEGEGRDDQRS